MMMAHDQAGQPLAPVSDEVRHSLRSALERYLAEGGDITILRAPVHELAAECRRRGIHAEHLLILLKEIWYALPAVQQIRSPEQQSRLLQRVVTVSIRVYYEVPDPER